MMEDTISTLLSRLYSAIGIGSHPGDKMYEKYYDIKQLQASLGVTRTSIYNWINNRGFPHPIRVSRRSLWNKEDVERWCMENHSVTFASPRSYRK
jgi:predicted DNA-binding transcriptional regulator AlpA